MTKLLLILASVLPLPAQYLTFGFNNGAGGGGGTYTLINHKAAGSTNTTSATTAAADMTGANLLVAVNCTYNGAGAGTFSDSSGNTWSSLTAATSGTVRAQIFYVISPTVSATQTFTISGATNYPAVAVAGLKDTGGTPVQDQSNHGTGSVGTSVQPGNVTPTAANEVVVQGLCPDNTYNTLALSGYTIDDSVALIPGQNYGAALAHVIQTTATATNPTWTWANSASTVAFAVTFKP